MDTLYHPCQLAGADGHERGKQPAEDCKSSSNPVTQQRERKAPFVRQRKVVVDCAACQKNSYCDHNSRGHAGAEFYAMVLFFESCETGYEVICH